MKEDIFFIHRRTPSYGNALSFGEVYVDVGHLYTLQEHALYLYAYEEWENRAGSSIANVGPRIRSFYYISEGKASLRTPGGKFTVKKGDIVIRLPGNDVWEVLSGCMRRRTLMLHNCALLSLLLDFGKLKDVLFFHPSSNRHFINCLDEIQHCVSRNPPDCLCRISLQLYAYVIGLGAISAPTVVSLNFKKLLFSLERDPGGSYAIADMAQFCGVTPRSLNRLFRKHVNMTPVQYLQMQRMLLAAWLIRQQNPPVDELALRCGYRDVSYFIRIFRQFHGVTPGKYLKRD